LTAGCTSQLRMSYWVEVKWWHCPRTPSHVRRRRPSCFPDSEDRASCDPRTASNAQGMSWPRAIFAKA
jgi:hypothetical protein